MIKKTIFLLAISLFFLFSGSLCELRAEEFFWEEPAVFDSQQGSFPVSAYSDNFAVAAWQEMTPNMDRSIAADGIINIRLAVKEPGTGWMHRGVVAGPYPYSGAIPSILSIVIDNNGRILIAVAVGSQAEILISGDRGYSFSRNNVELGVENTVAPRIFTRADGGYLLFVTRGYSQALSIYYSRSNNGTDWLPFEYFTPESVMALNFLPVHASIGNRDIVFYQSIVSEAEGSSVFQLYFKTSDNGGLTWSQTKRFTTFNDPVTQPLASPDSFDNQRPHLAKYGNNLLLVWERRYLTQSPQIYGAVINSNGDITGSVERINAEEAYCNNPIGFIYRNIPTVVWFDNRRGISRIVMAQKDNLFWNNNQLSGNSAESSFARPVVTDDGVYVFWQETARNTERILVLSPDTSVNSPRVTAVNFTPSTPSQAERARVSWDAPYDTSGIAGFSWVWSQNENALPPRQLMIGNTGSLSLDLATDRDGEWFFSISALDFAGNWSEPSRISFYRKTEAPEELTVFEPEIDASGYIASNDFELSWPASSDPFLAGYTWNLQYLRDENENINAPPPYVMGTETSVRYENQDNGIWGFSVAAIDRAGNIGQASEIVFRANKFIAYTSISFIDAFQDEQGILSVNIIGRGFITEGEITSVVLSQPDQPDVSGNFTIFSDREIGGITFDNPNEGEYQIKLYHSERGWYTSEPFTASARTGTVKTGGYSNQWRPSWTIREQGKITINPITILAVLLVIFCVIGSLAAIRGIGGVISESTAVNKEANAIITGDFMPLEKKQKFVRVKKKRIGLRFKLVAFTFALVLLVVAGISTPIYLMMTETHRRTLYEGLWDRSKVLLEGIASSARDYFPLGDQGALELGFLPARSTALPEANYITITGYRADSIYNDHVWATNDPDILSKIDTTEYRPGVSRITDTLTQGYEQYSTELNNRARSEAGNLSRSIVELTQESRALSLSTNIADQQRFDDIQVTVRSLEVRLTEILSEISGQIGSQPLFSSDNTKGDSERVYIFYKPVMYRQGAEDNYFRGLVRLEVSLDLIMEAISQEQRVLLRTILFLALIALLIGISGAFILAAFIIHPIRKLVSHIEIIRDTEDKSKLAGVDIDIKTKDEIAILGSTINDMTHGLVKAALAASDLSIGKEIQKKFIPLDVDKNGNKQTSGLKETKNLNFFGYYEGAKGVSGDYFDYLDLDGRYYAVIKCDVAGKGIPAALIMIQVATMFLNHFRNWKPTEKGMHMEEVVYQINDFIEALGFKGRFAAFTLCLFDSETGVVRFCNAGDNIIHYYDASAGNVKMITLPQSPATGILPNSMIEISSGYKVQTVTIDHGDILLLYTDGIEESKRKFRNSDFKEITCTEGQIDTPHENHLCGQADEEMSPERVTEIINAVMSKKIYNLKKYHNPEGEMELQFDFSSCEGHVEEVIMAMVSAEKMFRCYNDPKADEESRVLVDKKVDNFLKNHFLQYRRYCSHTREYPENDAYMYYTHVMEDDQYDDLTILGIKRK